MSGQNQATDEASHTARVRELNDAFRKAPHARGKFCLTRGIAAMPMSTQLAILHRVMTFDAFTEDNDPYQEHNFGGFEYSDQKMFWKIDYYDRACEYGSDDPSDPTQTTRVMTIMLASEY
ncbi:Protein of unknown function [Rhodoblastus acidophilus]|uniref:DUF3768 domain-containing protein n=1 Tax=Rhodoblastus acidophilus TaxID=1074 RepID=A0A212SED5_RHOAC|nr:DUF3768 domain-containing protein [Rhodoblastus acidophilus]PPQ35154.1 DUF3768 domain-containing protein [Rhodoblastus acidophilus]RAI16899.1 DUF3768 domain-containing protein [Rhodoblastus acidophilus]SNB83988.1 Protein of unknown function [Rhodoblastus acidophilus]